MLHAILTKSKVISLSSFDRLVSLVKMHCDFFYVHVTVHRRKFLYNKTNQMHQFPKFTPI